MYNLVVPFTTEIQNLYLSKSGASTQTSVDASKLGLALEKHSNIYVFPYSQTPMLNRDLYEICHLAAG